MCYSNVANLCASKPEGIVQGPCFMAASGSLSPVTYPANDHSPGAAGVVRDPGCGMPGGATKTTHPTPPDGRSFFFCSARCRDQFAAEPSRYLNPAAVAPPKAARETQW